MSKTYAKIWVHTVWSTKNRTHIIKPKIEQQLFDFLKEELHKMNCIVRIVNGMPDHVHCLFSLNPQKSISEIVKQLKGSSSHFVNSNNLIEEKFVWQRGFGVFGVSHSAVEVVHQYIQHQKQHHSKRTFEKEYLQFMRVHGFLDVKLED